VPPETGLSAAALTGAGRGGGGGNTLRRGIYLRADAFCRAQRRPAESIAVIRTCAERGPEARSVRENRETTAVSRENGGESFFLDPLPVLTPVFVSAHRERIFYRHARAPMHSPSLSFCCFVCANIRKQTIEDCGHRWIVISAFRFVNRDPFSGLQRRNLSNNLISLGYKDNPCRFVFSPVKSGEKVERLWILCIVF